MDKNLPNFLAALWDDITGKDANGRDAEFKKWYSEMMLALTGTGTIVSLFAFPPLGLVLGAVFVWKFKLHLTNTF